MLTPTELATAPPADLVLIDPYGHEEAAFNYIRELRLNQAGKRTSAVLIVTGHVLMQSLQDMRGCGADYVIAKPFSTSVLLDRILWVAGAEARRSTLMAPEFATAPTAEAGMR